MVKTYKDLYGEYKNSMMSLMEGNDFYEHILDLIERGDNRFSLLNRYFEKNIDLRWVEEIEKCIVPLDTIIRNPRRFIVQEEEIVPIERARKITSESVRHLAQHTNLIARVDGDRVTPSSILNVFREESYEIYENRFIYTLLKNLEHFLNLRYNVLFKMADDENMSSLKMESSIYNGTEKINYKLEVSTQDAQDKTKLTSPVIDTKEATAFQRIERIKGIISEFTRSSFINELHGCTLVRPPIMRTNIISMDPNFRACLDLWHFISSYDDVGYEIVTKETDEMVNDDYRQELYKLVGVNYLLLKNNSLNPEEVKGKVRKRKIKPKMLKRLAEELALNYDIEEVEIKRIFVEEFKRATQRKNKGEEKIKAAIDRALDAEKKRKEEIEAKIKEKIQRQKEIEKRKREREAARIAKQKALEKERKIRNEKQQKAKNEKAQAERAKRREKERLAQLKAKHLTEELAAQKMHDEKVQTVSEDVKLVEIEKVAASKQREKELRARARAAKLERDRAERDRISEENRLEKLQVKNLEQETAAKEKLKEKDSNLREKTKQQKFEKAVAAQKGGKEGRAIEKAAQKAKDKAEREKQREKENLARLKATQREKEIAAKDRLREKGRIARELAKQYEKENIAVQKQIEKERLERERAKQIAKEKIARTKLSEKERFSKLKAQQLEKEEIVKKRLSEKERIAQQKAQELEKLKAANARRKEKERKEREEAKQKEKAAKAKKQNTKRKQTQKSQPDLNKGEEKSD